MQHCNSNCTRPNERAAAPRPHIKLQPIEWKQEQTGRRASAGRARRKCLLLVSVVVDGLDAMRCLSGFGDDVRGCAGHQWPPFLSSRGKETEASFLPYPAWWIGQAACYRWQTMHTLTHTRHIERDGNSSTRPRRSIGKTVLVGSPRKVQDVSCSTFRIRSTGTSKLN